MRPCHLGATDRPETVVLGDLFSMQVYQRLVAKKDLQGRFTFLTSSGCPPVTGIRYIRDVLHCNGFFEKAFAYAAQRNPDRLVLISNWSIYFNLANEKICFIDGNSCLMKLRDEKFFVPYVDAVFASSAKFCANSRNAEPRS